MKIRRTALISACVIGAMSMVITAVRANEGTDGVRTDLQAEDLAVVLAGEKIYQTQCAACHGDQMQGQPDWRSRDESGMLPAPPHDKSGHTWHHADDLLFEITKYGPGVVIGDSSYQSKMPAYKEVLTDQDIVAVLSYIKHSWPDEERSWQNEVNGNQGNGFTPLKRKSTFLDKLLK